MTTTVPSVRRRRILAGAAVAMTFVAVAGCSSGNKQDAAKLKPAAATKPAKTSTTTGAAAAPACTPEAVRGVLLGGTTNTGSALPVSNISVVCGDGYAAVSFSNSMADVSSLLKADGSHWVVVPTDQESKICAQGNPMGLPQAVYGAACTN